MIDFKSKTKNLAAWEEFAQSYLALARLGCEEIIKGKYDFSDFDDPLVKDSNFNTRVFVFSIAIIYNIKHALEILIKAFIRQLDTKNETNIASHDLEQLFKILDNKVDVIEIKKIINKLDQKKYPQDLKNAKEKVKILDKLILSFKEIVLKYYELNFLKNKFEYRIKDVCNTMFRYPENKIEVEIEYMSLIYGMNEKDILLIKRDIDNLEKIIFDLSNIFYFYIHKDNFAS